MNEVHVDLDELGRVRLRRAGEGSGVYTLETTEALRAFFQAERPEWASEIRADCAAELTAATPHLRAAWEQEMAEKIRAKFLGPDFGRNPVNGQDSPDAALHAAYDEGLQTALALLEGGDNQ